MNDAAWLIERGPEYLSFQGGHIEDEHSCKGTFEWHRDPHLAIRFARKQDAVRTLAALRMMTDYMLYGATRAGLRSDDPTPRVAEHLWIDDDAAIAEGRGK